MRLKNESAANSKISVRGGGILAVGADGILEVEDKEVANRLISAGWKKVGASKAPQKTEPKKEEPKKEEPKEEPKASPKKSVIPKKERPSFKRKAEAE